MNGNSALVGKVGAFILGSMLWASGLALAASEVSITRTNWSERWITNVIEVTIPTNRFVNEYHTNWAMRTVTNLVEVEALWTNSVVAYRTNWITRTHTNTVAVNVLQTNFVDRYHTNWSTLNLTNWETVVVFKTNWVAQPVTNVVPVDLPARRAAAMPAQSEVAAPKEAPAETLSPALAAAWTGPLAIEAARTTRPPANNQVEVQLKVRWTGSTTAPLQVQHWKVEREDAAVLLFGQEQEFKRQLPVGKYKVEAKLRTEGDNPPLSARGTLLVTASEAVIQQRLLVKK